MVDRRLCLALLVVTLFVTVLHAERARNDHRQDDDEAAEEDEQDLASDNNRSDAEELIDTVKRFLLGKKTTTKKPTSDSISALLTTTKPNTVITTSTKSSAFGDMFGKKTSSTSRYGQTSSTSRYSSGRVTTASTKDACGTINPCKNGGSCKTLSSGRFYCFCSQDYYGKNCENKFMSTGADNKDRARTDHCAKSPCRNGGECVGLRTTFYCRCKTPFYGISCDKRLSKREEIVDESVSSEQDVNVYERELQEDTEDLRRAIANENMLDNFE